MPRRGSPYGPAYERYRAWLAAVPQPCRFHCGRRATSGDHDPPLSEHVHVEGSGCCALRPACLPCQCHQGGMLSPGRGRRRRRRPTPSRRW